MYRDGGYTEERRNLDKEDLQNFLREELIYAIDKQIKNSLMF